MESKETKSFVKKKQIVDALKRCLDGDVYSRISVQDIATEAGFSKGGVLHYFPTKEDIYLELTSSLFQEFYDAHSAVLKSGLEKNKELAMSSLVGTEEFVLNKNNTKILINLILYSFEDEKVRKELSHFLKLHRIFLSRIISSLPKKDKTRGNTKKDDSMESDEDKSQSSTQKNDVSLKFSPNQLSRITQSILFSIALLEFIDPIDFDYTQIASFLTKLLRD